MIPLLYALICLIWGSTWVVIKIGLVGVPPFLAAGLRFLLSSLVLFALVAWRRPSLRLDRDDRISILSCGLGSFTIAYALVYWAEQYISSALTAVLCCTMPLVVALLSRFWTRSETLTGRKVGGILIGMAGTALLFWQGGPVSPRALAAMAAALLSSLAAAVNLVMMKKHSQKTDIFVLNAFGMGLGALCLLTLSALTEWQTAVVWSRSNILAIVYLALIGSVTAFLAYFHLVKVMDATRLSLITLVFPLVAVILGRLLLQEAISPRTWAGMATVLCGVALSVSGSGGARYRPSIPPPNR